MSSDRRLYAKLVRLYPREFRRDCAGDMIQAFEGLVEHKGRAAAWRRVLVDLAVTLPTYRMETLMAHQRSTRTLLGIATALGLAAVATVAMGLWPVAAILLLAAFTMAASGRSHLARSLRPEDRSHRRRLLARSGLLGVLAAVVLFVGLVDLGDENHWPAGRLLLYNGLFFGAIIGALAHLLVASRHAEDTDDLSSMPGPA